MNSNSPLNIDDFLKTLQNKINVPLGSIQKGSLTTFNAIQKGTAVSMTAIQSILQNRGRLQSVINGIIGDTLDKTKSRLAIKMSLIGNVCDDAGKICILVHGLCASEDSWQFSDDPQTTYGSLLIKDFGYSPFYLRYNSGLHISTNGRLLNRHINRLCNNRSQKIREIIFIGHSLGGLVIRSACHYGMKSNSNWTRRVKKIFLLGTPHHGSDVEKLGNLTTTVLKIIPNHVTHGISHLGNKRSAGIKDLRFGYLLDEDWKGHDQDALLKDNRHPVPLLKAVDYYIIAGTISKKSNNLFAQYFGDGMVNSNSVTGKSFKKSKHIHFLPKYFRTFKGISHAKLSCHADVYDQIKKWCRA
ncbi:MAG: hypothetical protein HQM16_16655 [Deltaproteobacteria bacterium]|nr:hypothetical protein [Deltaproteobacteria bacterium]